MPQSTTSVPAPSSTSQRPTLGVLVFHKTEEFRHNSIEAGIQAIHDLADSEGYNVKVSDDASAFSSSTLSEFGVVVFLNTTGNVLDESQQRELERFIQSGKGFVGVHSAADTEYDWEWYGGLIGAYFDSHPEPQSARVSFIATHPVTADVPDEAEMFDEWYNFRTQPGPNVTVVATLDESTYEGGEMGGQHPIVWAQDYDGGRSVYIGFGHTPESFSEPLIRKLLGNAIAWAGGG
jgi:cytochrome c